MDSDAVASVISAAIVLSVVELVKLVTQKGLVCRHHARKLMHVGVGPIFLLTWRLFSDGPHAKYYAAVVPLGMTAKFALTGLGVIRGSFLGADAEVRAMSRTGNRTELLRGPLAYGITFVVCTVRGFRQVGAAAALMALCFGDGLAEPVGRRYGEAPLGKLPWSPKKTWAGSLAVFFGSFVSSLAFAAIFHGWGFSSSPPGEVQPALLLASIAGALVESLPLADVDNLLVPLVVFWVFSTIRPL